jgi:hypothetical protein
VFWLQRVRAIRVPWGLLGMFGLVLAIETAVARDVLDFSDPVSLSWRLAARSARSEAPRRDVLCTGDSLVKHALIPGIIAARSGRTAVNLAVAQGPVPATYVLFRRALDAGARPAAVVVDFKANLLASSPRHNLRYWQEILSLRETLELARSSRSVTLFVEIALGQLLPSFRARHEIRSNLMAALRGETDVLRGINRACQRNWTLNDGANVAARNPGFTGALGPDSDAKYLTGAFYCHRVNLDYIHRFFTLAESRGIRVYWLLPPLTPALQARREQQGAEMAYVHFARSLQTRYPSLTILDARHAGYAHTVFVDPTHLDRHGASTLSRDVADVLQRDLADGAGSPRWTPLPAYRAVPPEAAPEDTEQSRRKLVLLNKKARQS